MDEEAVGTLPPEAFSRGIAALPNPKQAARCLILGLDCEYESAAPHGIVSYQLSDGTNDVLLEATEDMTWKQLATWVKDTAKSWGHDVRSYRTILLVSHFSTAELSHIKDFWKEAKVRRVSPQQVYNASYRTSGSLNIVVVDQYHFFGKSLEKVAKVWGEEKMDYDTKHVTRETLKDPKFREYAVHDARLCARIFTKFRNRVLLDHNIDIVKRPTPAAIAMAIFRHKFQSEDYGAPHPRVRRQAWLSLWGGRAEAYACGTWDERDYTLRDVKSLYPTSAINIGKFPRAWDWKERREPRTWRGLCRVSFQFPDRVRFPCLPVYHDGRLIFPSSGTSDCSLDEAWVARSLGAKLTFHRVYEYDDGTLDLRNYMVKQMAEKDAAEAAGDEPGREMAKLNANSLIGKFSQNRGDIDIEDMKQLAEQLGIPLEVVMDPAFRDPGKRSGRIHRIGGHIMPEWSALILGKARATMALLLNQVNSLLCSTDSLLVPDHENAIVDRIMTDIGVVLTNKNKECKKCGGPAKTTRLRIVRNRVYAAKCQHGVMVFGANHAIHLPQRDDEDPARNPALEFILSDAPSYATRRRAGLKTAIKSGVRFFEEKKVPTMTFDRRWDKKRRLLPDGSTQPWRSVAEYDEANGIRAPKFKRLKATPPSRSMRQSKRLPATGQPT